MAVHNGHQDTGYAWVVLAANFLNLSLNGGSSYLFGLFYPYFLDTFGAGPVVTMSVSSVQTIMCFSVGLLAGSLCDTFGCRVVNFVGTVLCTIGFVMAALAPSIVYLYVGYTISGIGIGLHYVPVIVSIQLYFNKKLTIAMGIASSGVGFGTFIFSPIITMLSEHYGWRGAMLIFAGIFTNGLVFASLLRPIPAHSNKRYQEVAKLQSNSCIISDVRIPNAKCQPHESVGVGGDTENVQVSAKLILSREDINRFVKDGEKSNVDHNEDKLDSQGIDVTNINPVNSDDGDKNKGFLDNHIDFERQLILTIPEKAEWKPTKSQSILDVSYKDQNLRTYIFQSNLDVKEDSRDVESISNLNALQRGEPNVVQSTASIHLSISNVGSIVNVQCATDTDEMTHGPQGLRDKIVLSLKNMFDISLYTNVYVILFQLVTTMLALAHYSLYTFTPRRAEAEGFSPYEISLTLSIVGLGDIVGRIVSGLIGVRMDNTILYLVGSLWIMVLFVLTSLHLSFIQLAVMTFLLAVGVGTHVSMSCTAIVYYVGQAQFARVYGFLLIGSLMGSGIHAPLGAYLYEVLGSYNSVYQVLAVFPLVAAALLVVCLLLRRLGVGGHALDASETLVQ